MMSWVQILLGSQRIIWTL